MFLLMYVLPHTVICVVSVKAVILPFGKDDTVTIFLSKCKGKSDFYFHSRRVSLEGAGASAKRVRTSRDAAPCLNSAGNKGSNFSRDEVGFAIV